LIKNNSKQRLTVCWISWIILSSSLTPPPHIFTFVSVFYNFTSLFQFLLSNCIPKSYYSINTVIITNDYKRYNPVFTTLICNLPIIIICSHSLNHRCSLVGSAVRDLFNFVSEEGSFIFDNKGQYIFSSLLGTLKPYSNLAFTSLKLFLVT
jgi:hypothetical protein